MIFIGIDALPQEGRVYVGQGIMEATFEYPNGGKEAIDMTLQILAGEKVPKEVTLPSRIYTRDNLERGGEELKFE